MKQYEKLCEIIDQFTKAKILAVGDMILDRFVTGTVSRISPEAPVPVVDYVSESFKLGGGANAINNIAILGGKALAVGVIGTDEEGKTLKKLMYNSGIETKGIITIDRPTNIKTRIIANQQQVVRIDKEKIELLNSKYCQQIFNFVKTEIDDADAVLISDYDKGVITKKLLKNIIPLAKKHNKPIIVDPKDIHFLDYKGITIATPNLKEASYAAHIHPIDEKSIRNIGKLLLKKLQSEGILITRGKDGMTLFEKNGDETNIPTVAKEVYDVSGAGDTVTGVISLGLAAGATMKNAAIIANAAAGLVVEKLGPCTVTRDELKQQIMEISKK